MKRSNPIAGMTIVALCAVAALLVATPPAAAETGIAPLRATQNAPADVQATLDAACATCHDLSAVQPGLYTMAEWQATIDRMLGYGASLTAEQNDSILAFLATDAPAADEGGGVDPAAAQAVLNSACATCHDLSGVEPGVYTGAEWTDTINRMLGYGASVSEEQFELLLDFLATDR